MDIIPIWTQNQSRLSTLVLGLWDKGRLEPTSSVWLKSLCWGRVARNSPPATLQSPSSAPCWRKVTEHLLSEESCGFHVANSQPSTPEQSIDRWFRVERSASQQVHPLCLHFFIYKVMRPNPWCAERHSIDPSPRLQSQ